MKPITRAVLALGFAGLLLVPATAAGAAPSDQDTTYLKAAHQSNLAEIAGGKLAQQKGSSQQVKDLGARFVTDHTKLDAALRQTATALKVDLPSAPNDQQQAVAAKYRATSGADFDSLFVSTQMDAHMAAMNLGQKEIAQGDDAQAKKAAQSAAPVIASHHSALEDAARSLGVPSRIGTGLGEWGGSRGLPDREARRDQLGELRAGRAPGSPGTTLAPMRPTVWTVIMSTRTGVPGTARERAWHG